MNFEQPEGLKNTLEKISYKDLKRYLNNTITPVKKPGEEELKKYFENISNAYKRQDLVLVLGSGVSVPYKIPDWKTLLQKLLLETFNNSREDKNESFVLASLYPELFPSSPLISARFLEKDFNKKQQIRTFEEAVKEALYEKVDRSKDSSTMKEILNYCVPSGRSPNLNSIITYNYDDILEGVLNKSQVDIQYKSIFKVGMNPETGELPIYHVHGYLPQEEEIDKDQMFTLSESLYHKQYSEIYSWNNMVQINKFKDNTCVFVGISLTDPNIRRLLDISAVQRGENAKNHYLIKKKYTTKNMEKNLRRVLRDNPLLFERKGEARLELNRTIEILLEKMEEFEELDAESFGIKIIWINEHEEIAGILKRIRNNYDYNIKSKSES